MIRIPRGCWQGYEQLDHHLASSCKCSVDILNVIAWRYSIYSYKGASSVIGIVHRICVQDGRVELRPFELFKGYR